MLTLTDNECSLEIYEQVDMEREPGCEHSGHANGDPIHHGPAWGVIRLHPSCSCPETTLLICESGYKKAPELMRCRHCGTYALKSAVWELVSVL